MTSIETNQYAAAICGVLHNLYFHKPTAQFLAQFRQQPLLESWPQMAETGIHNSAIALMQASLEQESDDQIERDYYQLFIGPGDMQAYPWGSVYTDRENLLFGNTTQAWMAFLKRWQVSIELDEHQPQDHLGIILGVMGQLLENDQQRAVNELLTEHLMPWAPRLLECIETHANTGFYRGAGQLTAQLLQRLMSDRELTATQVVLFK